MPAITLTDISFSFTAEPLLAGITLTVADGERACLVGPNGCGKTTLLRDRKSTRLNSSHLR